MGEIGKIAMLGGDERQIYLARALAKRGRAVYAWGLGSDFDRICPAKAVQTPSEALDGASVVLLPMPASLDGVRVHSPLAQDGSLRFSTILDQWEGGLLLGGKLPPILQTHPRKDRVEWIDYAEDDVLQLKNALPTAEGAIAIAMRELPISIRIPLLTTICPRISFPRR